MYNKKLIYLFSFKEDEKEKMTRTTVDQSINDENDIDENDEKIEISI